MKSCISQACLTVLEQLDQSRAEAAASSTGPLSGEQTVSRYVVHMSECEKLARTDNIAPHALSCHQSLVQMEDIGQYNGAGHNCRSLVAIVLISGGSRVVAESLTDDGLRSGAV
nr:hypothetical protein CFP56_32333 [Quercus suber]